MEVPPLSDGVAQVASEAALAKSDSDGSSGNSSASAMIGAPDPKAPWLTVFIDELGVQVASGCIAGPGNEVYLRDLPEDMSETDLEKWLSDFGKLEETIFLRHGHAGEVCESGSILGDLSGCGYARFATPEGAAAFIAAFPADEPGNVQGSRSISEHLQMQLEQPGGGGLGALLRRLPTLREETSCPSLSLVGTGSSEGGHSMDSQCGGAPTAKGPLRFSWLRAELDHATELFRHAVSKAVAEVLELSSPPPKQQSDANGRLENQHGLHDSLGGQRHRRRRRRREPGFRPQAEAPPPSSILLRGIPENWEEKDVQSLFALFGGVDSINFMGSPSSRVGHVKLKDLQMTAEAVAKLHGTEVGDGDMIAKCIISCELLDGASKEELTSHQLSVRETDGEVSHHLPRRERLRPDAATPAWHLPPPPSSWHQPPPGPPLPGPPPHWPHWRDAFLYPVVPPAWNCHMAAVPAAPPERQKKRHRRHRKEPDRHKDRSPSVDKSESIVSSFGFVSENRRSSYSPSLSPSSQGSLSESESDPRRRRTRTETCDAYQRKPKRRRVRRRRGHRSYKEEACLEDTRRSRSRERGLDVKSRSPTRPRVCLKPRRECIEPSRRSRHSRRVFVNGSR